METTKVSRWVVFELKAWCLGLVHLMVKRKAGEKLEEKIVEMRVQELKLVDQMAENTAAK